MTDALQEPTTRKDTGKSELRKEEQSLLWWTTHRIILVILLILISLFLWLLYTINSTEKSSPLASPQSRKMTCYFDLKLGETEYTSVPNDLCTHIFLSFVGVGPDYRINISRFGRTFQDALNTVKRAVQALELNGKRKVMVSIGGGSSDPISFSSLVENRDRVEVFLKSCSELIEQTGIDGIDYDWEFPTTSDRSNFASFLEKSRAMIDQVMEKSNKSGLLSVALPGPFMLSFGYTVDSLTRYCDFVNVMTYDLVLLDPYYRTVFHNALFSQGILVMPCSADFSIRFWLGRGIPRQKLYMGIPTYAVTYALEDKDKPGLFKSVTGYSELGANIYYGDVCRLANLSTAKTSWSEESRVPYMHDGRGNWISYENVQSVKEKVEYAVSQGLGGLMIFSLNADDVRGVCGEGIFPLTRAAHNSWMAEAKI